MSDPLAALAAAMRADADASDSVERPLELVYSARSRLAGELLRLTVLGAGLEADVSINVLPAEDEAQYVAGLATSSALPVLFDAVKGVEVGQPLSIIQYLYTVAHPSGGSASSRARYSEGDTLRAVLATETVLRFLRENASVAPTPARGETPGDAMKRRVTGQLEQLAAVLLQRPLEEREPDEADEAEAAAIAAKAASAGAAGGAGASAGTVGSAAADEASSASPAPAGRHRRVVVTYGDLAAWFFCDVVARTYSRDGFVALCGGEDASPLPHLYRALAASHPAVQAFVKWKAAQPTAAAAPSAAAPAAPAAAAAALAAPASAAPSDAAAVASSSAPATAASSALPGFAAPVGSVSGGSGSGGAGAGAAPVAGSPALPGFAPAASGGSASSSAGAAASSAASNRAAAPVAVTGCNGFIASWVVAFLLQNGETVHGTLRGDVEDPARTAHLRGLPGAGERLKLFSADLTGDDPAAIAAGFDAAFAGCRAVMHCASPFFLAPRTAVEAEVELLRPAIEGTRAVLAAAARADCVRRVVLTSSMAAVYQRPPPPPPAPAHGSSIAAAASGAGAAASGAGAEAGASAAGAGAAAKPESSPAFTPLDHLYTEADWSDEAYMRSSGQFYALSKQLAERTAWRFMGCDADDAPACRYNSRIEGCELPPHRRPGGSAPLDMVTICPTLTVGPVLQPGINESSGQLLELLRGTKAVLPNRGKCIVDVRDVAAAHVLALDAANPAARGRICMTAGSLSWRAMAEILRATLPGAPVPRAVEPGPPPHPQAYVSTRKAVALGVRLTPMEESLRDAALSLYARGHLEAVLPPLVDRRQPPLPDTPAPAPRAPRVETAVASAAAAAK